MSPTNEGLTVEDLMTQSPISVTKDTPLDRVWLKMKTYGCRQLPVLNDDNTLVGIVTNRDVLRAMSSPKSLDRRQLNEESLRRFTTGKCMTANPMTVKPDTLAYQAANMLSLYKIGALPVVRDGILVGILTVTNFLEYFAESRSLVI